MNLNDILSALWQRKRAFLLTFTLCLAAVVAVTLSLPKRYSATAVLYIGSSEQGQAQALDASVVEQLTRTYASLVGNRSVTESVRTRLPFNVSASELEGSMSFAPVENTQLLQITAKAESAARARNIANVYASTFTARTASRFAEGRVPAKVSVNEDAPLPDSPTDPNPPLYIGLGALLSALLATGAVLLRDRFDVRLNVPHDAQTVLGQPVLARLPRTSRTGPDQLAVDDAFRMLNANIEFAGEKPVRSIMVTSPDPSAGKTTVAAALAISNVADGKRVLLIEADLRRPALESSKPWSDIQRPRTGLANYLLELNDFDEVVHPHPAVPNLACIWSGPVPPNPSSLLRSQRFDSLLARAAKRFHRIIIDTAPVAVGADASILAARVDGVLCVLDANRTGAAQARNALEQLRRAHAPMLGVALNGVSSRSAGGYGYGAQPHLGYEGAVQAAGDTH